MTAVARTLYLGWLRLFEGYMLAAVVSSDTNVFLVGTKLAHQLLDSLTMVQVCSTFQFKPQ